MAIAKILILGAGPAGLSAAISLSKISTDTEPLQITVFELRDRPQPLGGSISMTPLALRYLDRLGAGQRLRSRAAVVRAIDVASLRTGKSLGSLWDGMDTLRTRRLDVIDALLETVREECPSSVVDIRWGMSAVSIHESRSSEDGGDIQDSGKVVVEFKSGESVKGDLLLCCDGIHSVGRSLYVDPDRPKVYTGRAAVGGFVQLDRGPGQDGLLLCDEVGTPALRDTTVISGQRGSLLVSYYDTDRTTVNIGAVVDMPETTDPGVSAIDGWRARGRDQEAIKQDMKSRFQTGKVKGLAQLVDGCDHWLLYPVYKLPPGGTWHKGRVLLLGDAAHAMPPQGESTGVAIEDGVLIARVLERRGSRTVSQLLVDYETLRRPVINKLYKETAFRWNHSSTDQNLLQAVLLEWLTVAFVAFMNWRKETYFSHDVKNLTLPP